MAVIQTPELVTLIQAELKAQGVEASKDAVKAHQKAYKAVIAKALKEGNDVEQKGFVSFTSKETEAYVGRNPKTGEDVDVPAARRASATLAKPLRKFEI